MIAYRKACNRAKSMENVKDNPTVREYFREMGLSPLCTSDTVGYIPAFADLLAERENEEMKRFETVSVNSQKGCSHILLP